MEDGANGETGDNAQWPVMVVKGSDQGHAQIRRLNITAQGASGRDKRVQSVVPKSVPVGIHF